jgi:hypothetical protein
MRGLSLTQPWATLVALGAKRIETRSRSTKYRGPVAIHASKGFPREYRALCFDEPFYGVLHGARMIYPDLELGFGDERFLMSLGAIVATARIITCAPTDQLQAINRAYGRGGLLPHELTFGDYSPGRFAWVLGDVRRLPNPIHCRGALGLWTVPDDIARRLEVA